MHNPFEKNDLITLYPELVFELFRACKDGVSFKQWSDYVITISDNFDDVEQQNKFKGDMLEILAALFFMSFELAPEFGISNYMCNALEDDYGVDGYGVNVNKQNTVVQVKFRSNPTNNIKYEELAKTFMDGVLYHGLDHTNNGTLVLFTNANEVDYVCANRLGTTLKFINNEIISYYISNNKQFWYNVFCFIVYYIKTNIKSFNLNEQLINELSLINKEI